MLLQHIKYFLKYNDITTNIQIVIGGLHLNSYLWISLCSFSIGREQAQSTWIKACVLVVDMLPLCSTFKATVSVLYVFQRN